MQQLFAPVVFNGRPIPVFAKAPGLTPAAKEVRTGLARLGHEGRARIGRNAETIAATGTSMMPEQVWGQVLKCEFQEKPSLCPRLPRLTLC